MKQKLIIKVGTIIAIVIVTALGLATLAVMTLTPTKEVKDTSAITRELKGEFMLGCNDGTNYIFCDCIFEEIVDEMGIEKFATEALRYELSGELSDSLADTMVNKTITCL